MLEGVASWLSRLMDSPLGTALSFLIVALARAVIRSLKDRRKPQGSSRSSPPPAT